MAIHKRKMWLLIGVLSSIFSTSVFVLAGEIITEVYPHTSDIPVTFSDTETFVICERCERSKGLVVKPSMPLVIKLSGGSKTDATSLVKPSFDHQPSRYSGKGFAQVDTQKTQIFTLRFSFDSDRLTLESGEKLRKIIRKIKALGGTKKISVLGYSCNIGDRAHNIALSERRAMRVEQILKSSELTTSQVLGKGDCCPISKNRALNRRVEIIVEHGGRNEPNE